MLFRVLVDRIWHWSPSKRKLSGIHLYDGQDVFTWFPTSYGKSLCYHKLLTFTQNLGNAVAHAHYHPWNEYQATFPPPPPKLSYIKKRLGDEARLGWDMVIVRMRHSITPAYCTGP